MNELDAYRCAKLLLDQHGRNAHIQAAMRVDDLNTVGDEAGRRNWVAILRAIDELSRIERRTSEPLQ